MTYEELQQRRERIEARLAARVQFDGDSGLADCISALLDWTEQARAIDYDRALSIAEKELGL